MSEPHDDWPIGGLSDEGKKPKPKPKPAPPEGDRPAAEKEPPKISP